MLHLGVTKYSNSFCIIILLSSTVMSWYNIDSYILKLLLSDLKKNHRNYYYLKNLGESNTFTFMHLADAFIQSDLHCVQVTVSTFYQLLLSLGIEPMILALLAPCSTSWATGKLIEMSMVNIYFPTSEKAVWECSPICTNVFKTLLFCNYKSLEKSWKNCGNVF